MKMIDNTIPKFLLTGVINTLVGALVMFLLYNLAGCSYWFSSAANYLVGGTVSFSSISISPSETASAPGRRSCASR